jgi:hypothetical protein
VSPRKKKSQKETDPQGETMKRIIFSLGMLSIILLACNISKNVTTPVVTVPPVVSIVPVATVPPTDSMQPDVTLQPVDTVIPTSTETPITTNLTCNNLSLYLDPALASGTNCEIIPEIAEGMEVYPQYTRLTLEGFVLSEKFFSPHISVFPVQRFSELLPDFIPERVSTLQALNNGGATGDSLPFLPVFNAGQVFHAQYRVIPFSTGGGIRYLTEFAQYLAPVNNTDLFYTYQGVTNDGQFWVSVILPVNLPFLPADAINPPGGLSWEEFSNNYGSYIVDMINQLDSQPVENYTPSLAVIDELVSSINIQP